MDHSTSSETIDQVISEEAIADRLSSLAAEIAKAHKKDLVVIPILTGSFIFAADLVRALYRAGLSPTIDFLSLASYHEGKTSSGSVKILRDVISPIKGRDVLIVDDILESGRTLNFAKSHLMAKAPRSVHTCILLDKKVERAVPINADYAAFTCPDVFVIGYGMDLANRYRELPYVGKLCEGSDG